MTFEEQSKIITDTHINAKVDLINEILAEIKEEGYVSVAQVRGSLLGYLESYEKLRVKYE